MDFSSMENTAYGNANLLRSLHILHLIYVRLILKSFVASMSFIFHYVTLKQLLLIKNKLE